MKRSAPVIFKPPVSAKWEPLAVDPGQFRDLWHGRRTAPERELAAAVLEMAVADVINYRLARNRSRQRMYWEAHRWMTSADRQWPFSFVNICDYLGVSAEWLRARVLEPRPHTSDASAA